MKNTLLLLILIATLALSACSGGKNNPLIPQTGSGDINIHNNTTPIAASDVLYHRYSNGTEGYKAFGIFLVRIDPTTLQAEIIPSRAAEAIGHTFDSDLTQFLTKAPCYNCIQIGGVKYLGNNQVQIGFSVKHPFPTLATRPDLHAFDVRGIVIADGTQNFSNILVAKAPTNLVPARANTTLLANPDGYTHHFDDLAEDTNYFNPPRGYDANINPFKRFFENGTAGTFDPMNPVGYNVMKTGASWQTVNYIFNVPQGGQGIEFAFVVDGAYGQSATFQNRTSPYYFLPEFNRKEAWKVNVEIVSNNLKSENNTSTAQIKVTVCDWQAKATVDPNYPNTSNLSGIKQKSDVAAVELQIPSVCGVVQVQNPASGNGSASNPYVYNLNVTNTLSAKAGTYYGIVAVRDDLQGQQGPMAIPASPSTFPGPEIYDYSTYQIFPIRVGGSPPVVTNITVPPSIYEGSTISISANFSESDGDSVTFMWEQVSPATPVGTFIDPTVRNPKFILPDLTDVPEVGLQFTIRCTATDIDGSGSKDANFLVKEYNYPPICQGIDTMPYNGIVQVGTEMIFSAVATDPDGTPLIFEWDFDYDGTMFIVEDTGQMVMHTYDKPGFYTVACKVSEDRTYALYTMCQRTIIVEGFYGQDIKVDASSSADPNYHKPDLAYINKGYHAVWLSNDNYDIIYANNEEDLLAFSNHFTIANKPTTGQNMNPKIAGFGNVVLVAWVEYDTSTAPATYRLKTRRSTDAGRNWATTITVDSGQSPIVMGDIALCRGPLPNNFYLVYEKKDGSGNLKCYLTSTTDGGVNWSTPPGGGQFRDNFGVGDYVSNFVLDLLPIGMNGTIYVLWLDGRTSPPKFLLDWSGDGGATWHTDIEVDTGGTSFNDCDLTHDSKSKAYIVTLKDPGILSYFSCTFSGGPNVSIKFSSNLGASSIDIFVPPSGSSIFIPYTDSSADVRLIYSPDGGNIFGDTGYVYSHSTGSTYDVGCDGLWYQAPDREQIFLIWVDNRGGSGSEAHIYGNLVYKAG